MREIGAEELAAAARGDPAGDCASTLGHVRPTCRRSTSGHTRLPVRADVACARLRPACAARGARLHRADHRARRRRHSRRRCERLLRLRGRRGRRPDRDRAPHQRAGQFAARDRCVPRTARARAPTSRSGTTCGMGAGHDRRPRADRHGVAGRRRRRRRGRRLRRRARLGRARHGGQGGLDLGRPAGARVSRAASRSERESFAEAAKIYVGYGAAYRGARRTACVG